MTATAVLEPRPVREWALLALAVGLSLTVHCVGAVSAAQIEPHADNEPVWVEMVVEVVEPEPDVQPEPEPEVQPEPVPDVQPEPEPEPPEVPEEVEFEPPTPTPHPPVPPPPEVKPVPRMVQGLSNDSFVDGAGTNLAVNRGNTTATRATNEKLDPEETIGEFAILPFTSVTTAPKARYKPKLVIPAAVIEAELEGRVEILLTIDAAGKVTATSLVSAFHPDAGVACLAAMKKSRWKAGAKDGTPVITKNVPYSCRFEMAVD